MMDTILISLAVFIAVILLFRTAVLPFDPSFSCKELLSAEALKYRLNTLGKAHGSFERGYGVDCSKTVVKLKRTVRRLRKKDGASLSDTERMLVENRDTVLSALNRSVKALGYGYKIGGKKPRIFLLCEQMASHSDCCLTPKSISAYVGAFTEHSRLTVTEALMIPHMLRFILCGMILRVVTQSASLEKKCARGIRDGSAGRVDLDSLRVPEYVCGLYEGADSAYASVLDRLSENGISRGDAEYLTDLSRAQSYTVASCAVDSLNSIDGLDAEQILRFSPSYRLLCMSPDFYSLEEDTKIQVLDALVKKSARKGADESSVAAEILRGGIESITAENKSNGASRYVILAVAFILSVITAVCVYFFASFDAALAVFGFFIFLRCYVGLMSFALKVVGRYRPDVCTLLSHNKTDRGTSRTVKADLFADFKQYISECKAICRQLVSGPRQDRLGRLIDISLILAPIAQFVVLLLCSVRFSQAALVILFAPMIVDTSICAYYLIVDRSVRPLVRPVSALISLLTIPMNAFFLLGAIVFGFFKWDIKDDGDKIDYRLPAACCQLLVGAGVIALSVVLDGGAVMISLGAAILIAAAVPYLPAIRFRDKKKISNGPVNEPSEDLCDDRVYFFGDSSYKLNLLRSESIFVVTDNCGKVTIRGRCNNDVALYSLTVRHGKTDLIAASCGVFERGRSVYKCVADGIELCFELIAPIDSAAVLCRVHAVNTAEIDKTMELHVICKRSKGVSFAYFGVFGDGEADAITNTEENKVDAALRLYVKAFAKSTRTVAVVFGSDKSEIAHTSKVLTQLPFEHFAKGGALFCRLRNDDIDTAISLCGQFDCDGEVADPTKPSVVVRVDNEADTAYIRRVKRLKDFGFAFNTVIIGDLEFSDAEIADGDVVISARSDSFLAKRAQEIAVNGRRKNNAPGMRQSPLFCENASDITHLGTGYSSPRLPVAEPDIMLGDIGVLRDSALVTDGSGDTVNILCDKLYRTALFSDGSSLSQFDGEELCEADEDLTALFIGLGENGAIWSPTKTPFYRGEFLQRHGFGYCEYVCAYNGCEATLKRYPARGFDAEIFDLTVKNNEPTDRVIDAFISASVCKRPFSASFVGNTAVVRNKITGEGFAIISSKNVEDTCLYREGYYRYGRVFCSSGFRSGGITLAPTLSVKLELSASKTDRAVFCLAKLNGELKISAIDDRTADDIFSAERSLWRDRTFVLPRTSERTLDHLYMWATYRVNTFIDDALIPDLYKIGFLYNAVKYTRSDEFEAAIGRVGNIDFFDKSDRFTVAFDIVPECSQPLLLIFALKRFIDLKRDNYCLTELYDGCMRALNKVCIDTAKELFDIRAYALLYSALNIALDRFAVGDEKKLCLEKIRTVKASIERRFDMLSSPSHTLDALMCVLCGVFYREKAKKLLDVTEKQVFRKDITPDSVLMLLLYAEACYRVDDDERAYRAVELAVRHGLRDIILRADSGHDIVSAIFAELVTERIFGISYSVDGIAFSPRTAANTPHIEYTINIGEGVSVRIADDDINGSWRIKSGGITYASDRIKTDGKHKEILLQRQVAN